MNAGFCHDDQTIGWDRGELLPALQEAHGDMGVTMVLAHEYGHAVQYQAGMVDEDTPTLVSEQQADCLAGVVHAVGRRRQFAALRTVDR